MLEHSTALTEADLLNIIELMAPDRSVAIAKRKQLGKKVTDVLVARGDQEVVRSVTANPGAKFSDRTMRMVAEKAKKDADLREKLVDRTDVAKPIIVQLTPFLSEELKQRLAALDDVDGGSLLDSLSEITGEEDLPSGSRKTKAEADAAVEQVTSGQSTLSEAAEKIALVGHFPVLTLFLSRLGEIPEPALTAAFKAKNGTKFASICKGLGITKQAFTAIAHLRAKRTGMSKAEADGYVESYGRIPTAEAEKLLATLKN